MHINICSGEQILQMELAAAVHCQLILMCFREGLYLF